MNTANKLTLSRIVMAIIILILLMVPWSDFGITIPNVLVMNKIIVDIRYPIAGFIFVIACVTDYLDGSIARREKNTSDFGAIMDAIADKILINGLLIILAYNGFISVVVPVIIVTRDIVIDSLRIFAAKGNVIVKANKWGKIKTVFMMIGISFMLFYNLPFEVYGIYFADIMIYIATILSVVSGVIYFWNIKDKIKLN